MSAGIVIVGGGLAAQRCCETLRRSGWDGRTQMVCGEHERPYDRPPLSKDLLKEPEAAPSFRPSEWYSDNGVELLLGTRAHDLDAEARVLELEGGAALHYDRLLAATGAEPVLPALFSGRDNVHVLRDFGDATRLRDAVTAGAQVTIVGAGFLGLEVAATLRGLDAHVSLVELAQRPLARVLPESVGAWFAQLHAGEGVELHLGDGVALVHGANGTVETLELQSGTRIPCDVVVVAVGVRPATGWLSRLLEPGHPLVAAPDGSTAIAGVYAAGDISGTQQWEAAARGGPAAARGMLGLPAAPDPPTSFWTDQYGVRIQFVGEHADADTTSHDGDFDRRDFAITWSRDGHTIGGLLAGRPRELPALRRLIQQSETNGGGEHELQGANR